LCHPPFIVFIIPYNHIYVKPIIWNMRNLFAKRLIPIIWKYKAHPGKLWRKRLVLKCKK